MDDNNYCSECGHVIYGIGCDVCKLTEEAEALAEVMSNAYAYLKGFSCKENCDPGVGFHHPECGIKSDFNDALTRWNKYRGEK